MAGSSTLTTVASSPATKEPMIAASRTSRLGSIRRISRYPLGPKRSVRIHSGAMPMPSSSAVALSTKPLEPHT